VYIINITHFYEAIMVKKIEKITIYVNNQEEDKKFRTEKLNFVIKFNNKRIM